MERKKKPVHLRAVDDPAVKPVPVIRLANRETAWKEHDGKPIRLGPAVGEGAVSQRLALPTKEDIELRTHQPGIEVIIETGVADPDFLEQHWGETSARRNPIPWGWFALIGLAITGAVVWSLTRVEKADDLADQIRSITQSVLINEAREEREAGQLIDRLDQTLRDFFDTTSLESLARLVRHPQRVTPLMQKYYADQPVFASRLKSVKMLRPLTLDDRGNFWMASIVLTNGKTHNLIIEILESGEARIDWETLVCYQPMKWDDFVAQRPAGTSLDFRVYVERDDFYSHEFGDPTRWTCFRLTALDSEETLFGYAPAESNEAQALLGLLEQNGGRRTTLILRLGIPEGLHSRRGVVIEKLVNTRWIYLDPPVASS